MVKDVAPGSAWSRPDSLHSIAGRLVFAAADVAFNVEPWVSDGTAAGTTKLIEFVPGSNGGYPTWFEIGNGRVLAAADLYVGGSPRGQELFTSDLTTAGTVLLQEFCPGSCNSFPGPFSRVDGPTGPFVIFTVSDGQPGAPLWRTDGTPAGTSLVGNLAATQTFAGLGTFVPHNGWTYFRLISVPNGDQLWRTDGTAAGTSLVWAPGTSSTFATFSQHFVWNQELYIVATVEGFPRASLFRVNTAAGTGATFVLDPEGPTNASPSFFEPSRPSDARLFFYVYLLDDDFVPMGNSVWSMESPSSQPTLLTTIPYSSSTNALGFQGLSITRGGAGGRGRAYWTHEPVDNQTFLWTSDGTPAGTRVIATFQDAFGTFPLGSHLLFAADDGVRGGELWITDGTTAGTRPITDLWPGPGTGAAIFETNFQYPEFAVVGDTLFFNANDGQHGFEPWAWRHPLLADCNGNARPDFEDLSDGTLRDSNHDAVPDACQCLADWNGSGTDDEQDLFDFLGLWFDSLTTPGESADVDGDGATDADDIFAFLSRWFLGC